MTRLRFLFALLVPAALSAAPVVVVDAKDTAQPVSPYIYGQFIEHLGRCIYGGIWAEMLEDRKFYYPITGTYAPYTELKDTAFPVVGASPWEIVGEASGVSMDTRDPFVGEHSPRLRAGTGVRQHDLGVVAGKSYTGYVWVKAIGKPAHLQVALSWGDGGSARLAESIGVPTGDFAKQRFQFTAGASTDHANLELDASDADLEIGTVSLMPSDNVQGMRKDTLALLKELGGTIYRWPGGNFTSGYDWRDGIGDRDRRPPRKNPAWTGVEHNDFGTDEFIAFCKEIGAEPMISVNTGLGDAYSAAQWVQYCNGKASTLAGGWRAANGNEAPYAVQRWCVGNEMFGPWQLGFMQLKHYEIKHNLVAEAMWKVDASLKLTAVGDLDATNQKYDPDLAASGHTWSYGMLQACADHMTYISEHFYEGRLPWTKDGRVGPLEEAPLIKMTIRRKADTERAIEASLPNLKGRTIPISMDEWNFWHRDYVYGELGCVYDLQDGLGIAEGLHEYYRQTDIIRMAFYAQTVNVIGAIKTSKTAANMETTGRVFEMYRRHFGEIPLRIKDVYAPLDVAAALTSDGKALTVAVVNPTAGEAQVVLVPRNLTLSGAGSRWVVTGPDAGAHNTPDQPDRVRIGQSDGVDAKQPLKVPALGAAVFVFPLSR